MTGTKTDAEILAMADNIRVRRERKARGRKLYLASSVSVCGWNEGEHHDAFDQLRLTQSPELYALICKELGVDNLEVEDADQTN
jgi:hypothetical protein